MQRALSVVEAPHPILRKKTQKIESFNDTFRAFLDQMMTVMKESKGAGLAAPQVGESLHVFTMLISESKPYKMCNLEILSKSDETISYTEGCLSFPGVFLEIERPKSVHVRYWDEFGQMIEEEFTEWEARCIQHELDHLEGKLFIDQLSSDRKDFIIRKIQKGKAEI